MEVGHPEEERYLTYPWSKKKKKYIYIYIYLSSLPTPGARGEVQNAITRSLSTHINKELTFVFFVCFDESAFRFNVFDAGKPSA